MLEFDWDEANIAHIARHGIIPAEVEQALRGQTLQLNTEMREGEKRLRVLGETESLLILLVVHTDRSGKIRPITAWKAGKGLRKLWLQQLGSTP